MKYLLLLPLFSSCTIKPFEYDPNTGKMTSLGGTLMTRSASENSYAYNPSTGTQFQYNVQGHDETAVPRAYFIERGVTSIAGSALNGYRTAESTRRILGGQSVSKLGIRAARDVRLAEIAAPPIVP